MLLVADMRHLQPLHEIAGAREVDPIVTVDQPVADAQTRLLLPTPGGPSSTRLAPGSIQPSPLPPRFTPSFSREF